MDIKVHYTPKKGPYAEFNISGDPEHFEHWQELSIFLEDEIFGIFDDCFSKSSEKFNFYGPTLYMDKDLAKLEFELNGKLARLRMINDIDSFYKVVTESMMGMNFIGELEIEKYDIESTWPDILSSIKEIAVTLISLITRCISEHRVLWIIGI